MSNVLNTWWFQTAEWVDPALLVGSTVVKDIEEYAMHMKIDLGSGPKASKLAVVKK